MQYYISPPPMNPLTRLLAAILGVLAMVGAFILGFAVIAVFLGIAILFWIAFRLRLWWLRRQLGDDPEAFVYQEVHKRSQSGGEESIDAEYTVISSNREENQ